MHLLPSAIRPGLWILPISGVLWIIGSPLRGNFPEPTTDPAGFAAALVAPSYILGVYINLLGLFLSTFGFIALWAHLKESNPGRAALAGMVLTILGQEMILSLYGIFVFVFPCIGGLHSLNGLRAVLAIELLTHPGFVVVYIVSGLAYVTGSILSGVVMVRRVAYPVWVAVCFALSALVLCWAPAFRVPVPLSNVVGSLLLIASGGWIAWRAK
jgi:hypothetical protein